MKNSEIRIFTGLDPQEYLTQDMHQQMDMRACISALETHFHPDGIKCLDCGSMERFGGGKTPKGVPRYRCKECGTSYTVISHTPFSGTKLGPRKVVLFMWLLGLGLSPVAIGNAVSLSRAAVSTIIQKITLYARFNHNRN